MIWLKKMWVVMALASFSWLPFAAVSCYLPRTLMSFLLTSLGLILTWTASEGSSYEESSNPHDQHKLFVNSHSLCWGQSESRPHLAFSQQRKDYISSSHSPRSLNVYIATLGHPPTPSESQGGQLKTCSCSPVTASPDSALSSLLLEDLCIAGTRTCHQNHPPWRPAPECTFMTGFSQEGSSTHLVRCLLHFPIKK